MVLVLLFDACWLVPLLVVLSEFCGLLVLHDMVVSAKIVNNIRYLLFFM